MPWRWPSWLCRLVLSLLVLILPFVIRGWFLWQVPDVGEPFDVKSFYPADLPPEQNAFTHYNEAQRIRFLVAEVWLKRGTPPIPTDHAFPQVFVEGLSALSPSENQWLADQRATLDEWRRGTELSLAQAFTLKEMGIATGLDIHQDHSIFIALARIESLRCEADGDLNAAWEWCRACVRFSRHLNSHSGKMQRWLGVDAHKLVVDGVMRWAEHPAVTADQLRAVLAEIRAEYAKYAPLSEMLKMEHLFWSQSFTSSKWTEDGLGLFLNRPAWEKRVPALAVLRRPAMWLVGEPDVYLRLHRQILLNQLNEIDKPLGQRTKLVGTKAMLFDPDPNVPMKRGQLDPTRLERAMPASVVWQITDTCGIPTKPVEDHVSMERTRQAALEVLLAAQAYRRDKGEYPESLDELVPQYLEAVPLDPCDRHGGRLLYRRDSAINAVVGSVGVNEFVLKVAEPK